MTLRPATNTFVHAPLVAPIALAALRDATVFGSLVHRDAESAFTGGAGASVTIKRPTTFEAKVFNRANGIQLQDIVETSASVTLTTLLDVSAPVTAEELTLDVVSLRAEVIQPAMDAIADGVEEALVGELANVTQTVALNAANPHNSFIDAKVLLDQAKAPQAGRSLLLDPATAGDFLKSDRGANADVRGDQGAALTNAFVGRVAGFDIYTSNALPAGTSVAFHRNAFALVVRALALPAGAAAERKGALAQEGVAIRWVYDYDINLKQDVMSFDTLVGTETLAANQAVLITRGA